MEILKVKGSRIMKKMANKNFEVLCEDYNNAVKIIDTFKRILNENLYEKGDIDKLYPTSFEALKMVHLHGSVVENDLEVTIELLEERLHEAEEYKKVNLVTPLLAWRLDEMENLLIYLREMLIEVNKITEELSEIISRIADIEEMPFL